MLKHLKQLLILFGTYFLAVTCLAQSSQSLGGAIGNVLQPLGMLGQLIKVVCIIAGVGMLVGSLVRYKRHRQNPVEAPLSSCIMLFLTGLALLALALIPVPS
jgi:Ca2+/H+ antiporter